jgi:putative heme iron utilization protein
VTSAESGPGGSHQVSGDQVEQTERTLAATPGLRGEPTDAERARTLFAYSRHAALATVALDPAGYPFGSLVGHALDDAGRPLLCLSDLAEHTTNLKADARASLMVSALAEAGTDPLAGARATLIGELREVPGDERADAHDVYRGAHPEAFYSGFADFRLYRLEVEAVRYVGGFGRMSWVNAQHYGAAEADPLHPQADRIIDHMNDDHDDALVRFCQVLGGRPGTGWARMVRVDRYGFDVLAADSGGPADQEQRKAVRIVFEQPCDTPEAVRAAMVALVGKVRNAG